MKTRVQGVPLDFHPVDLVITLESRKEVEVLRCIFNSPAKVFVSNNQPFPRDLTLTQEELRRTKLHFQLFNQVQDILDQLPKKGASL